MLKRSLCLLAVLILLPLSFTVHAQERLNGRSRLELKVGYAGIAAGGTDYRTSVGMSGVDVSYGGSGFMGGLSFSHWLQEDLSVFVAMTGIGVSSDVESGWTGVSTSTVSIGQLHMGMRYFLSGKNPHSSVRPYLALSAGPVMGTQSETRVDYEVVVTSHTESAVGARLSSGMDILASRKFSFGAEVGYNLMSDFSGDIGGTRNYSGPEFALNFGWLFGSAK